MDKQKSKIENVYLNQDGKREMRIDNIRCNKTGYVQKKVQRRTETGER